MSRDPAGAAAVEGGLTPHAAEEALRVLFERATEGIFVLDDQVRVVEANPSFARMLGLALDELVALDPHEWDVSAEPSLETVAMLSSPDPRPSTFERRLRRKDGSVFDAEISCSPALWNGRRLFFHTCRDISDRKREEAERARLQAQFVQAQKMESVGRLAGGVAHDFNNMLAVILGRAELALEDLDPPPPLRAALQEIRHAALRSASLTRQLLAFSRRQTIDPKVLDLNDTVGGMLQMLRRLIGEDIDLSWTPMDALWHVRIDPAQIDQILANLTVNARDAIAGIGQIRIETANVHLDAAFCASHVGFRPGDYAALVVQDDGCGMPREVLDHVFEPFFTTKGPGQGTGLGLPTVYGIVKQNDGFVSVESAPGMGTTVRIYLPRVSAPVTRHARPDAAAPRGAGEAILLVEDEAALLHMGTNMLRGLGYEVIPAGSPDLALEIGSREIDRIQLLMTDVVMPGMNGRELALRLRALRPDVRCLFMSGYTADVIARRGVLDEGVDFLEKPFSLADLARKVRTILDTVPASLPTA